MVDPVTVGASISILASVVSIAASVKQLMVSRNIGVQEAIEGYRKQATPEEEEILNDPDLVETISKLTIISDRLLKQLSSEADECEKKHIQDRQNASGQIDKDQADIDASACMCGVLRDIRRYNQGQLPPTGPFNDWWIQYSCKA